MGTPKEALVNMAQKVGCKASCKSLPAPAVLCPQVRQSAGLLLKNNLKAQYASLSEEYKAFIKVGQPHGSSV